MQDTEFDIGTALQNGIVWIFVILAGLIFPVLLIPLIKFTGHSEIVEEIAKAVAVLFLILKLPSNKARLFAGAIFGLLFGLSESMLYLTNILQLGDFSIFWQRLLWTVPMHITTVLLMVAISLTRKWLLIFGFVGAVILHILFNSVIAGMLFI